ncbi:MAG: TRAP transporter substrate-binding protein DctP, partial [Deltaproteobacteria bacterium]
QEVDYVLEKMNDELNRGFARRGYQVLGWTELGFIYLMSTIPIDEVADLRGKKVWTTANSPMANAVFVRAQVSPVTISAPDVLVALQTRLVEVVYNSPYYALITQWYTRTQYLIDLPLAYIGSGLIMSNRAFSRLPAELQAITKRVSAKHLLRVTAKTRQDNEDALNLMFKRGVQKITVEPVQVEQFKQLLDQAVNDINPKHLSRDYLRKVREALGEFQTLQK